MQSEVMNNVIYCNSIYADQCTYNKPERLTTLQPIYKIEYLATNKNNALENI